MTIFYRVIYNLDQFVRIRDFNFFFEALDFAKEIRQSGGRANVYRYPDIYEN